MSKKFWVIGTIVLLIILAGIFVTNPPQQNGGDESSAYSETVSWDEAIRILNSGVVEQVFQAHSLDVTLSLKDGRSVHTKEPGIDDIFDEVEKCGEPCKDILVATE
jgi:hypothetical protein